MKEKRLEIANELQKSINTKRGNMKDAAEFIAAMEGKKDIIIKADWDLIDQAYFRFPVHLAKSDRQLAIQRAGARCGKTNAAAAMVIELAKSPSLNS